MKKIRNSRKGFTLTEIVLVIAVVVILSSVSVVGIASTIQKANNAQDRINQHEDFEAQAWYEVNHITFWADTMGQAPAHTPDPEAVDKEVQKQINKWLEEGYSESDIEVTWDENNKYRTGAKLKPDAKPHKDNNGDGSSNGTATSTSTPTPTNTPTPTPTNTPTPTPVPTKVPTSSNGVSATVSGSQTDTPLGKGYQGSTKITGDGRGIRQITITAPEGVQIAKINDGSNSGLYTVEVSPDNTSVNVTFTANWGPSPKSTVDLNYIQWVGAKDLDCTYEITY